MIKSLSLRELAELLNDPDACGENLAVGDGPSRLQLAAVEALPSLLTLVKQMGEALEQADAWDDTNISFEAYMIRYKGCSSAWQNVIDALAAWERAKEK